MSALIVVWLLSQAPGSDAGTFTLEGEAAVSGALRFRRVHVTNSSNRTWHRCDVRLPDGRHFEFGDIGPGDEEGVMLFRFDDGGDQVTPWKEGVTVTCLEGAGRFPVSGHPPFSR